MHVNHSSFQFISVLNVGDNDDVHFYQSDKSLKY